MSLQTFIADQKSAGRRGRPRKYPADTNKLEVNETTPSPTTPISEDKPREERSYKDFFPDLDIKEPLAVIKLNETSSTDLSIKDSKNTFSLPIASYKKLPQDQLQNKSKKKKEDKNVESSFLKDHHSFHRPENHYIRYIEPSETELFDTIEYDMDEQDEIWLQIYNKERKKENLGQVSSELFEVVIDQLEKEWFNLIKNLPKKTTNEPLLPEDSKCAVCDDGECENSNAIVFCDGCNLAVHQDCYGIPYIPEGQWLCRKCMVSPENPVSCLFCPFEGGAFKQTTKNQWGHLLCAIWIPEVGLSNSVYMEPIDNTENIPKSRWKLTCYICRRRQGACIQCDNKHCFVAFHVTCARWARLCMRMKAHSTHYDDVVLKAYCDRHTPKDYRENIDVDRMVLSAQQWFMDSKHKLMMPHKRYVDEESEEEINYDLSKKDGCSKKQRRQQAVTQLLPASKAARAHQHQYTAGAPIAPEYILHKLESLSSVQSIKLSKKSSIITSICRYWSLKRESRRGAPLLKRLHLEPWTASASQLKQTEVEKALRASSMMSLRADLEKVRMLSEQVQKRERQKLERIRKQKAYLEMILYPIEIIIQPILEQLIEFDKKELFRYPVTLDLAPDYLDIIKQPMSFADILDKLSTHQYSTLDEFKFDLGLICQNSMLYNKVETPYYKLAQRLEKKIDELMTEAYGSLEHFKIKETTGILDLEIDPHLFSYGEPRSPPKGQKRRKTPDPEDDQKKKPRREDDKKRIVHRVTRSTTEKNKRTLRSRTISSTRTQEGTIQKSFKKPSADQTRTKRTVPTLVCPKQVEFIDQEIVWARVPKFPSHPAKIYDPNTSKKTIPDNVITLKPNDDDHVLVKFYLVGDSHTWGWVHKSDIHPFGNPTVDIDMLTQARRTRKPHRISEVKNGYRHVCNLSNIDPEPALNHVFIHKKK